MDGLGGRVVLLVALLIVAVSIGMWRWRTDGRARPVEGRALSAADLGSALGRIATLVQFSTLTCAPCRASRRVLSEVAERSAGVALIEVDAGERLELARVLNVRRTPTVFVLDSTGVVTSRFSGVPSEAQVEDALQTARVTGGTRS
jgi:thiol-disulfide isomerase/thioredoxin